MDVRGLASGMSRVAPILSHPPHQFCSQHSAANVNFRCRVLPSRVLADHLAKVVRCPVVWEIGRNRSRCCSSLGRSAELHVVCSHPVVVIEVICINPCYSVCVTDCCAIDEYAVAYYVTIDCNLFEQVYLDLCVITECICR